MKKQLLTLGLLSAFLSTNAQLVVDSKTANNPTSATLHIEKDALVYSSGGFEAKVNSYNAVDNYGNMMVDQTGLATAIFKVDNASEPNPTTSIVTMKRTGNNAYGQLYIKNIPQASITGKVNKEFAAITAHGDYQQIALPFYGMAMADLALTHQLNAGSILTADTEVNQARYKGRVMVWDNANAVFHDKPSTYNTSSGKPYDYYIIRKGTAYNTTWTPTTQVTVKGTPFADVATTATLINGGSTATFGATGDNRNQYNEKYKTYIYDPFVTTPWIGSFGKNLYQFGNPFLTNMDLSQIGTAETFTNPDGVVMSTIQGVRREPGTGVTYSSATGTVSSSDAIKVTFTAGVPSAGDVDQLIIRPLEAYYIKLSDAATQTFDMNGTRRFAQTARLAGDVRVITNMRASNSTVKQVKVIAKNANGEEVARTYYAVSDFATNGKSEEALLQAKSDVAQPLIYTNEEIPQGGIDPNSTDYKLYINEANENTFKGKEISMTLNNMVITTLSFELYEQGQKVTSLSGQENFYIKDANGIYTLLSESTNYPVNTSTYGLFYGKNQGALATEDLTKSGNTFVTKQNQGNDFIVIFNKKQSKANVEVYNVSGQLVYTKNNVNTSENLPLSLDKNLKTTYVVKVTYSNGEVVTKKIVK